MTENHDDRTDLYTLYLEELINDPSSVALEGQFIPRGIRQPGGQGNTVSDEQILVTTPGFVLVGPPGCGKTTQLRHWAVQTARRFLVPGGKQTDRWLPLYLDLTQIQGGFELGALIEFGLSAHGLDTSTAERQALLNETIPLLLIDNLDRIRDIGILEAVARLWRPVVRNRAGGEGSESGGPVSHMSVQVHGPRVVLVCRSEALSVYQGWLGELPLASLVPVDSRTMTHYLRLRLQDGATRISSATDVVYWLWRDPVLEDLAGHPLFLQALVDMAKAGDVNRAAVVELGMQRALESSMPQDPQSGRMALASLACALSRGESASLADRVEAGTPAHTSVDLNSLLETGLITVDGEYQELRFGHPLLQAQSEVWAWQARIADGEPLSKAVQTICSLHPWSMSEEEEIGWTTEDPSQEAMELVPPGRRDVLLSLFQLSSDKPTFLAAMLALEDGLPLVAHCLGQELDRIRVQGWLQQLLRSEVDPDVWYRLGESLISLGQEEAGRVALQRAEDIPDSGGAVPPVEVLDEASRGMARAWTAIIAGRWLGLVQEARGQTDMALESFHRVRDEVRALHAEVWYQLGRLQMSCEDFGGAIPLLQKALLLKPDNGRWHREMAAAYNKIGNAERALAELQRAQELGQDPHDLHGQLAQAYQRMGQREEALASYQCARVMEPHNALYHRQTAVLLAEAGDSEGAINAWRRALAWNPDDSAGHHAIGQLYMEGGELERALFHLGEAVEIEPDRAVYQFDLGVCEAALGDRAGGIERLRRAVQLDSGQVEWHEVLAGVLEEEGLGLEAVEHYRVAIGLEPEEGRYHAALGRVLRGQGEYEEALSSLERALALRPEDGEILYQLGQTYEELGREEDAVGVYRRASEVSSRDAGPRRALARVYLSRGDVIGAQGELRLAVRLDPTDVWALTQLSRVYEETGHLEDALEALEIAAESAGTVEERAECHLRAGRLALRVGEVGVGREHLEEAVGLLPERAEAHHQLGRAYQRGGELGSAKEEYQRAIELAPEEAEYHAAVGEVGVELGLLDEARDETAEAIALRPREAAFHGQLGLIEWKSGHLSAARERYQQAVMLDPQDADHHLALAQLYQVEGQGEKSQKHLEVALATAPERADLHVAWGEFQAEVGEVEEALSSFARAVELAPEELEYVDRYGRGLMEAGQHEAAIRRLQGVLAREPERGETHHSLGQALEGMGCVDEAMRAYAKAADLLSGEGMADALYRLGRLALREKRMPEATEALEQVVQLRPQWTPAHHWLSLALEDAQEMERALLHARQAARLSTDDDHCQLHLGVLCNRLGLWDEAIGSLERVLTLPIPPTAEVHFELGRAFEGRGQEWWREAVAEYRRAVALAPQESHYHHRLGVLLARKLLAGSQAAEEDEREALNVLLATAELDPTDHEACFYLGRIFLAKGLWEEAVTQCRRAKELDPTNAGYRYHLAQALHQGGRDREALEELEDLPEESASSVLLKGTCEEALGDSLVALAAYQRATSLSPDSLESWYRQGSLLMAVDRWDQAVVALERALELAEERGDRVMQATLHRLLGRALTELSEPEAALMHLQQVAGLDGEDAEAYYLLGSLLLQQDEPAAAIRALKQAVDLNPTFARAHFALAQLYEQRGIEGDGDRSLASYEQAARCAPEEARYLKRWAHMLSMRGQDEEALPILHRVLEMDPQDAETHYCLGAAEETLGHLQAAHKAYVAAVNLEPDDPTYLEAKAVLQRRLLEARSRESGQRAPEAELEELADLWQHIVRIRGDLSPLIYRERGLVASMCGEDEKAARDLAQAVALAPEDPLMHRQRGQMLQQLGRHEEALQEALTAKRLEPDQAANRHLLAQCYLALDRHDEAMDALDQAIELSPTQAIYHHDLAETLAGVRQMESAAAALEQAIVLTPDEPSWHSRLGALRSRMGIHTKAIDAYQRAVELDPGNPSYQHDLALALTKTGRLSEAAEVLEKAMELAPEQIDWLLDLGQLHEQLGRYELAHQRYRQAAQQRSDDPQHLVHLARAAYLIGQDEEALQVLQQAIEMTEDWAPAFEALGDLHAHHDRYGEAAEAYLQATSLEPDQADYSYKLGRALHQLGEYAQAILYLERAATLDPHRATTYTELGDIYLHLERYDEAMQAYEQASVIAPGEADTVLRLAQLSHELGYLDQAQIHFQTLLDLGSDKAAAYAHLGAICADQSDFEGAVSNYLKAIELDPQQASYYYDVGLVYKQLREYKKAGHYFRQTVKLDPNSREAYKQFAAVSALSFLGQ